MQLKDISSAAKKNKFLTVFIVTNVKGKEGIMMGGE
jgi:hypothetical protein